MQKKNINKIISVLAAGMFLSGCVASGGERVDNSIEGIAERQWTQILDTLELSDDQAEQARVRAIAEKLLASAGEDPKLWRVAVFKEDDTINAFALPNRTIGIFTGLISNTENDAQLASVVGHEIGHVRLRHAQSRVNRGIAPGILIGVAKLPGAVTGIGVAKTAGNVAGGVVAVGTVYPFNREEELEADREGVRYMADSGYDPVEAVAFWETVSAVQSEKGANIPEFLSTHPGSEHRIKALKEEIRKISDESGV